MASATARGTPMPKAVLIADASNGRGWFRTSDLSRVKGALSHELRARGL